MTPLWITIWRALRFAPNLWPTTKGMPHLIVRRSVFSFAALILAASSGPLAAQDASPGKYDVTWETLGKNERDSMPLGNGDVGLNLWTDPSGDVVFLISKTDAWTENAQLVKLGRVRVKLTPNPFEAQGFRQTLKAGQGEIDLEGKGGTLRVWVDANHPVIHLEFEGNAPTTLTATNESWRTTARTVPPTGKELGGTGVFSRTSRGLAQPQRSRSFYRGLCPSGGCRSRCVSSVP